MISYDLFFFLLLLPMQENRILSGYRRLLNPRDYIRGNRSRCVFCVTKINARFIFIRLHNNQHVLFLCMRIPI